MKPLIYISAISFLLLSMVSCYTNKTLTSQEEFQNFIQKEDNKSNRANEKNKILLVITAAGDTVMFNKKFPGVIYKNEVYGIPVVLLPYSDVDSTFFANYSLKAIWKNGKQYNVLAQLPSGYFCQTTDTVSISIEEISLMQIRSFSKGKTAGVVLISTGAAFASFCAVMAIVMSNWDLDFYE